jgi:hypothetical protein
MAHETMTALVCTTGHVTQEEARMFDANDAPGDEMGSPMSWEYGWLFYIGGPNNFSDLSVFSDGLRGVIEYAWKHELEWIRFDNAAEEIDGITTYDW